MSEEFSLHKVVLNTKNNVLVEHKSETNSLQVKPIIRNMLTQKN